MGSLQCEMIGVAYLMVTMKESVWIGVSKSLTSTGFETEWTSIPECWCTTIV